MKTNKAVLTATALTLLTATSLFAQPAQRGNNSGSNNRGRIEQRGSDNATRSYRDNERVNSTGRITQLKQERDGYRVQLDNHRNSYWIPASRIRDRRNDLRVGVSIVLGGVFRGGRIDVDTIDWRDGRGYGNDSYVRGTVERIDRRNGVLILRESRGRTIEVDMTDTRRSNRVDFADLRRGDSVELSGHWSRSGLFVADAIEGVR